MGGRAHIDDVIGCVVQILAKLLEALGGTAVVVNEGARVRSQAVGKSGVVGLGVWCGSGVGCVGGWIGEAPARGGCCRKAEVNSRCEN